MPFVHVAFALFLFSCAHQQNSSVREYQNVYRYFDVTGEYTLEKKSYVKKGKLITQKVLRDARSDGVPVEKTIMISSIGHITNKSGRRVRVLKPVVSQHTVWFDGKEYFSQIKTLNKTPKLELILKSPEPKWNGKEEKVLKSNGAYCYWGQFVECLNAYGFIQKAIKNSNGRFSFNIIREQYPYYLENQSNVSDQVIISANVIYQEKKAKNHRFLMNFDNHSVIFEVNEKGSLEKLFWVAQGITITLI
jgi:hypothetical protein